MQKGLKTLTTVRAAVIAMTLCALLLGWAGMGGALANVSMAAIALLVMPPYLMICGFTAGLLPALACLLMTLGALYGAGGAGLLGVGALYLLPVSVVYGYCLWTRRHFWATCGAMLGALIAGTLAIYAVLQHVTGGALYEAAADMAAGALENADGLLYMLCSAGFLGLPSSMAETALVPLETGGYVFSAPAKHELLLQVRSIVMQLLHGAMPSLLISGNAVHVLSGMACGVYFGCRAARNRAYKRNEEQQDVPDLSMPPLSKWYIPRPWGLRLGILAIGYPVMSLAENDTLFLLGALMWQTFFVCFAVQGLATLNAAQKKRGTGQGWRILLIIASMTVSFLQTALLVVGVIDQISNARGLRPRKTPRNEEE